MLKNELVTLEPADQDSVDLLIRWTLDPVAQGPYKRVPDLSPDELRELFLNDPDRQYFLIRRTSNGAPLGRFYYRAWHFTADEQVIDWELNIFITEPAERGKGYGTAVQTLALSHLLTLPETRSVFVYTYAANKGERRALQKAGFEEIGPLPHPYYRVKQPPEPAMLYVKEKKSPT